MVLKDNSSRSGGNNTWALAVEGQTVVCPILVEDLSTPGQMLIEVCQRHMKERSLQFF